MAGAGPTTAAGYEEGVSLELLLGVVGVDGDTEQSNVGVASRLGGRERDDAVHPVRVSLTRHNFGTVEQIDQKRLGGRAPPDGDGGFAQGATQPAQGLRAILPRCDDLRDRRVISRRYGFADCDSGVDADAWAERQAEKLYDTRGERETLIGVLGFEASADCIRDLLRRLPGEPLAASHEQLQLHKVKPGGSLSDRVLGLQPCSHSHEGEGVLRRVVDELDGARPPVTGRPHKRRGSCTKFRLLLATQTRRPGLHDQLVVV